MGVIKMKIWIVSGTVSLIATTILSACIYHFIQRDMCLDSGGRWLYLVEGCDGAIYENTFYVISPIAIAALSIAWLVIYWLISLGCKKLIRSN